MVLDSDPSDMAPQGSRVRFAQWQRCAWLMMRGITSLGAPRQSAKLLRSGGSLSRTIGITGRLPGACQSSVRGIIENRMPTVRSPSHPVREAGLPAVQRVPGIPGARTAGRPGRPVSCWTRAQNRPVCDVVAKARLSQPSSNAVRRGRSRNEPCGPSSVAGNGQETRRHPASRRLRPGSARVGRKAA